MCGCARAFMIIKCTSEAPWPQKLWREKSSCCEFISVDEQQYCSVSEIYTVVSHQDNARAVHSGLETDRTDTVLTQHPAYGQGSRHVVQSSGDV